MPALKLRRLAAWFLRNQPVAKCAHCAMPWKMSPQAWLGARPHHIMYEEVTPGGIRHGLFMTCEWCWPRTTLAQRQAYLYDLVMVQWRSGSVPMQVEESMKIMRIVRPLLTEDLPLLLLY